MAQASQALKIHTSKQWLTGDGGRHSQLGEQGGQAHQSAPAHGLRPISERAAPHQLRQLCEDGTAEEVRACFLLARQ